ncbi:MAG: hypothetical protein C0524_02015 [Rhodobacter sp.]|nr:hypothetical protein [Rhodobacter sp.]
MLTRVFTSLQGTLILAVLAVALVATGFAHRAPSQTDSVLMAALLAGGSPADIWGDSDPDTSPGQVDCPACLITAAADLTPLQGLLQDLDLVLLAKVMAPPAARTIRTVLDPAHPAHGPPPSSDWRG